MMTPTTPVLLDTINPHSGLCNYCSRHLAQHAAYWADDSNFEGYPTITPVMRFRHIQAETTDRQAYCREEHWGPLA